MHHDGSNTSAVDEKLYSRQLYVMGHEAQRRMMSSRAVVVGLSGLGVEVAKNIILAGISSVVLCDPEKPNSFDLGGNFYLTEQDVQQNNGKSRAELCQSKLAELNEYVKVEVASQVSSLRDEAALLNLIQGFLAKSFVTLVSHSSFLIRMVKIPQQVKWRISSLPIQRW